MSQQSVPSVSSVLAVRDAAAMRWILPFRSSASDLSFDSPERRLARISTLASRSCSFAAALGV